LIVLALYNSNTHRLDGDVEIISRGVNLTDEKHCDIVRAVNKAVQEDETHQLFEITGAVKKAVKKQFYRDRQFPTVIPVIVED
jgi:mRNA degradation ribonuclease J1/J2